MARGWFVTGTDTEIGKTWVCCALLHALRAAGLQAQGLKPVASGCRRERGRLLNDDALALQAASAVALPYEAVNPCALEEPVSPHLAAAAQGLRIDVAALAAHCRRLGARADATLVEGVGGWYAPLTEAETVTHLARAIGWPVILVVGIRLGCLNHALLSARAIAADGLPLAGWVANHVDPHCRRAQENVRTLQRHLPAPLLGQLPHAPAAEPEQLATHLDAKRLLAG